LADTPNEPRVHPGLDYASEVTAMVTSANGVRRIGTAHDLSDIVSANKLCWIDIVGSDDVARGQLLQELGLEPAEQSWMLRFGQVGRMVIDRRKLRVVTLIAERPEALTEVHLLCLQKMILTVWNGNADALDGIRSQFAERASELERSHYQAAGIVLQFLLDTLHHAISELDDKLESLRQQGELRPGSLDLATLMDQLHRLQSVWSNVVRYRSSVRLAITGVEALPGIDQGGVTELRDYAHQVEDIELRMEHRSLWASHILQLYATALAQRQGEQINRLTLVATIFLPISFLTGFFGMNFNWMNQGLGSPIAFLLLGILLPVTSILLTVLWFRLRGLI
jgi:magnesium transporter